MLLAESLKVCHRLRPIAFDPILHRNRLVTASLRLSLSLTNRPSIASLRPPTASIYLTSTLVAARRINRSLVSSKLSRRLVQRPSVCRLVESNILPEECFCFTAGTVKGKERAVGGYVVSPGLIGPKRVLEKERVKDGLRGWLNGRRKEEVERRQKEEYERSVKGLVRRFAGRAKMVEMEEQRRINTVERESGWGRGGAVAGEKRKRRETPIADVSGLRKFWEGVGKGNSETTCTIPAEIQVRST